MAAKVFGGRVEPDGVVVLQVSAQSAVLCIELDEGTEHHPVIIDKLERYATQLGNRTGWHLLFVVPGRERLMRIRRLARRPLSQRCAGMRGSRSSRTFGDAASPPIPIPPRCDSQIGS